MDLVSATLGLPFAPLRGLLALARVLRDEAEQELYDPSRVRRELEEIEATAAEKGVNSQEAEQQVVNRLLQS
jgi:hypothetical protein